LTPNLVKREDERGIRVSERAIQALIARENARGIPTERIVLAGFSQGCAITLGAGLRYGQRLAGLAALSGYLPLAGHTAAERHAANAATPVFAAHGSRDGIVVPARGRDSRDALVALGQPVDWHEYPMEHSVCLEEVRDLEAWLKQVLA
jgi:phospholipase/carboxylesterase